MRGGYSTAPHLYRHFDDQLATRRAWTIARATAFNDPLDGAHFPRLGQWRERFGEPFPASPGVAHKKWDVSLRQNAVSAVILERVADRRVEVGRLAQLTLGQGLVVGNPTGGDMGAGAAPARRWRRLLRRQRPGDREHRHDPEKQVSPDLRTSTSWARRARK